jgi:hypothetical protein
MNPTTPANYFHALRRQCLWYVWGGAGVMVGALVLLCVVAEVDARMCVVVCVVLLGDSVLM